MKHFRGYSPGNTKKDAGAIRDGSGFEEGRLTYQRKRKASCTARGRFAALVTRPKLPLVGLVSGPLNCVRLRALNISTRICAWKRSTMRMFLMREASRLFT